MRTALIVDDSPLARAVLRRTLCEIDVSVDEAQSAEVAIEYLRSERPDVIFLDHLMPGMDGLEALHAIKANPDTAVIPVIMYTSQDGQLYMSQARALGALDVLPKTLKPADVRRLLRTHNLIDDSDTRPDIQRAVRDVQRAARGIAETARNVHDEKMLEVFRSELQKHRKTLLAELRVQRLQPHNEPMAVSPLTAPRLRPTDTTRLGKQLAVTTIATTSAAAFLVGAAYIIFTPLQSQRAQISQLPIPPEIAKVQRNVDSSPMLPGKSTNTDETDLAERSKAWVQHYAFGAIPLDDDRAREYEALLTDLKNEGFAGTVKVEIFEGRFCLNLTSDGSYELAPLDQPAMTCDRIGTPTETVSSTQQSISFSNMLAVATRGGQLRIQTVFYGPKLPIVDYPALDYETTAGEWNAAATYNQRVALRLPQDEFDAHARRIAEVGNRDALDRVMAELAP